MVQRSLFILGRQAAIGVAELESIYGHEQIQKINEDCVCSALLPGEINFGRIGSSVKLGAYLGTLPSSKWQDIRSLLTDFVLQCADDIPEGKIQIGLSTYGFHVAPQQLMASGLEIKKHLRNHGYSARLIPNKEPSLNSAQVLHNNLTNSRGVELLIVRAGSTTIVGRTTAVQDINAYAKRDQGRPKRDAFVGMLPPKLAQTIVNLATGQIKPDPKQVVLDPFCGTGVVLQEALLAGYGAYGSDLEPRMVDYSKQNLAWLNTRGSDSVVEAGDATNHHWQHPFTIVASEAYLGRPLSNWPAPEKLATIIQGCDTIIEKFLKNIASQMSRGTRLCIGIPAWIDPQKGAVKHLPMLDHLEVLGYNRVSFQQVSASELVYHRPDQLVGRELLVLTKR